MRAPRKIDKFLTDIGYGYGDNYYQRLSEKFPVSTFFHFGKHPAGLLSHIGVCYLVSNGGTTISPDELEVLRADGALEGIPSSFENEAFWAATEQDRLLATVSGDGLAWLERLCTPVLMVNVYDYLMGGDIPAPLPQLERPYIRRKSTPMRIRSKSAYLNLLGRYEESRTLLAEIHPKLITPTDRKIISDAAVGRVGVPPEAMDYFRKIGARIPSNGY